MSHDAVFSWKQGRRSHRKQAILYLLIVYTTSSKSGAAVYFQRPLFYCLMDSDAEATGSSMKDAVLIVGLQCGGSLIVKMCGCGK